MWASSQKSPHQLLDKHKNGKNLALELLMTINCLIVRNEFCAKVEECGGIPFAIDVLTEYPDSEVYWLRYLR